jgi:GNAT superfamily N-acetyltransferase
MGLGDEVDLAIFVRDAGTVVAGMSGCTWGDCCGLQSLWVEPDLRGRGLATQLLPAEAEAAARGCSQTSVTSTSTTQSSTNPATAKTSHRAAQAGTGTMPKPTGSQRAFTRSPGTQFRRLLARAVRGVYVCPAAASPAQSNAWPVCCSSCLV